MRYMVGQYRFPYAFQATKSLSSPTGYSSPRSRAARSTFSSGPLECELGTVDADDREVGLVLIVHSTQEGEGALAVHAREGPELEQDDAVAKGREPQRLAVRGVEPRIDADQFGSAAEDSQPSAASSSIGAREVFRGGKVITRLMVAGG